MDTTQDAPQVGSPTDVVEPTDLHVEVTYAETLNGTKIMNGTRYTHKPDETVDFTKTLADWSHGKNLPSLKSILVALAYCVHIVLDFFLDYFLWRIVFTLAVVEAPQIIVPAPWTDKKSDDDELPEVQQERSITKSLRTTIRHLYGVGGPFAMCRGMALHVSFHATIVALTMPFFIFSAARAFGAENDDTVLDRDTTLQERLIDSLRNTALEITANLLFCSWLAAWVHIVMTQHTLRIWYRRLPPFLPTLYATWRPLVILPVVGILVRSTMITLLKHSLGLYEAHETNEGIMISRNMLLTLIWLLAQGFELFLILPLEIAVVRIQASLLPDDEEPVVPFDRSFGTSGTNGLRPGLLAEPRGPLSLREARQSLSRTEMRRLVKTFAKMLAVQAAINAVFWLAMGNDVWPDNWVPTRVS